MAPGEGGCGHHAGGGRGGAAIAASGRGGADTHLGLRRERGGSATAEPCAILPVDTYDTNIRSSRDIDANADITPQLITLNQRTKSNRYHKNKHSRV
jgi:hypothetical protein